ncbi:GmrSD restriction endonuclease domain-containing protein [Mesonia mobilis]|uniref:GmrSD restriction endonuclease domain-containing protein n=2 Tax=Mesonia mobilis TaxID=369791 RepID=UPI0026EFB05B|nr:DUF262 domain-containing protein [Mesonia mobilis]
MATLFRKVDYNLQSLIQNIDMGTIGLPDIQRPFVWKDTKVRDLFDSMYKGYPVGYFLFWANAYTRENKGIGTNGKQKTPDLLIVDGQQRLTSLFAVTRAQEIIRENFNKEHIVISFKPLEEKFEIPDAASKRSPEYFQNISDIFNPNANLFSLTNNFITKLQQARELSNEEINTIQNNIQKLKNLENYPFSALELDASITEEQVADVFVRINSQGKKLNMADFILTLMSVFWDDGRKEIEDFCGASRTPDKTKATSYNYIIEPRPDQMLRVAVGLGFHRARLQYVYSILRGKDLKTGEFSNERRDTQFEQLKKAQKATLDVQNFHDFLKAIHLAGFIKGDYISSNNNLLYSYVFFLIGREQYQVKLHDLKNLIAKWFFMCTLTKRYTGSPETRMEIDLAKLRNVENDRDFIEVLNDIIQTAITEDFWTTILPMDGLATSSSTSPALYSYYAALNILEAKGLFSNLRVNDLLQQGIRSKKSALERHHLFPKAYLQKQGYDQTKRNQIANYALVEWDDNISISKKAPEVYSPLYKKRFSDQELEKMYFWHALPEKWESMDYNDFLVERRNKIAAVIKAAYDKLKQRV